MKNSTFKIGKQIEVKIKDGTLKFFFMKKEVSEFVRSFKFATRSGQPETYIEIEGSRFDDLYWEFAKEINYCGFHVNYIEDGDIYEFYFVNEESVVQAKHIRDWKIGGIKNKKEKRLCQHCFEMIGEDEPWCKKLHQ